MYRRLVAQLLILLAMIPTTAVAHSHSGPSDHDPDGLDRSPHVHLRFFLPSWLQHASAAIHVPAPGRAASAPDRTVPDHDGDAVYLSISVLGGWSRENSCGQLTSLASFATAWVPDGTVPMTEPAETVCRPKAVCLVCISAPRRLPLLI